MKKFRIVCEYDEVVICNCISCKENFECANVWKIKFCPNCGIKYDGIFDIRHKKYEIKSKYDWRNPGFLQDDGIIVQSNEARLMIELGTIVDKKFSSNCFSYENIKPYLDWRLFTHTTPRIMDSGPSAFVMLYQSYLTYKKHKNDSFIRLVYIKDKNRIIRDEKIDLEKLNAPVDKIGIRQSSVKCSGASVDFDDYSFRFN